MHVDSIRNRIPRDGGSYDVLVAGGGPAGIGAAVAAARCGARTLLLEARPYLGGVASTALWMPMNRLVTAGRPRGGVHDLLIAKMQSYGPDAYREGKRNFVDDDGFDFHPDYLRLGLLELLEESGCDYRLYTAVTGVDTSSDAVVGVRSAYKSVESRFGCGVAVDATGDGDLAAAAGVEMVQGHEQDPKFMPISLVFALSGVDVDRLESFMTSSHDEFRRTVETAKTRGYATAAWYAFDRGTVPGVVSVNNGGPAEVSGLDGTTPADLTLVERLGIRIAVDFVTIARDQAIPGLERCSLVRTGAAVSVRNTRRIAGEYEVTVEDAREGTDFPDVIARKYGVIDANQIFIGEMKSGFGYPYRAMVPLRIDNLLAAGRCGSATFLGHAAGKSMGNMIGLGQAAGVAAAVSVENGVPPRRVDVARVQKILREMNVQL
jgi:hypothetical protein